jgi:hypothetical protein
VKHPNFDSHAYQVDERGNMVNDYLRGELALRMLGGVDFRGVLILSLPCSSLPFCLILPLFMHFAGFCGFPSSR